MGEHGFVKKEWNAVSGKLGFQISDYQKLKNIGPIPEGKYILKSGELHNYDKASLYNKVVNWRGDWGKNRIQLHPLKGTNTFGRTGFNIHGGKEWGSAGCIDLQKNMPSFAREFLKENKNIILKVKY